MQSPVAENISLTGKKCDGMADKTAIGIKKGINC